MMRMAGRDSDGKARALKTDNLGNVGVGLSGSRSVLLKDLTPSGGLISNPSVYFGDALASSDTANNLDVSNYQSRTIVIKNTYNTPIVVDVIRFRELKTSPSDEILRVNHNNVIVESGKTVVIDSSMFPNLDKSLHFLQIRISRYKNAPTTGTVNVKVFGSSNPVNNEPVKLDLQKIYDDYRDKAVKKIHRGNYSWWTNEHAIMIQNKMYIGYITDLGEPCVVGFDAMDKDAKMQYFRLSRSVTGNQFAPDEHNCPALVSLQDGRIAAFYAGHEDTSYVSYRVSKNPHDVSDFGDEKRVNFPAPLHGVTYAQVHRMGNSLWLFTRADRVTWYVAVSNDNGETWGTPIKVLESTAGGRYYLLTRPYQTPSQYISIAAVGHPLQSADNAIRVGYITNTGDLRLFNGNTIGNILNGTNLPIEPSKLQTVYAPPAGKTVRLLDLSPRWNLRVAFAVFDKVANPVSAVYGYAKHTGSGQWTVNDNVVATGGFLAPGQTDGSESYVPGIAFTNDFDDIRDAMYVARFDGLKSKLELYESTNNGAAWTMTKLVREIKDKKLWRPIVASDSLENMPVYWVEGDYRGHTRLWKSDIVYRDYNDITF